MAMRSSKALEPDTVCDMLLRGVIVLALLASACASATDTSSTSPPVSTTAPTTTGGEASPIPNDPVVPVDSNGDVIGPAPEAPDGPLDSGLVDSLERLWISLEISVDMDALAEVGSSGDVRVAWLISDMLRFFQSGSVGEATVAAFNELTGSAVVIDGVRSPWKAATDRLFAWETPAPPAYVDYKARLYTLIEPAWQPFFDDPQSTIDWRFVSWGGVRIDDRPLGDPNPCERGCIPALDDPAVTDAAGGGWYPDDRIVFAIVIDGEARAYPKHIMEIHEMVNDTLGGRRIGVPYCTLCGSAQAFFTDRIPDGIATPTLRTSGLLSRSNKVMYDLVTGSVFDTFLGTALSGPLREAGVVLDQASVVTTTWGDWKAAHPDTTIVAEDGGIGRTYNLDPLAGRDDNGPIFPVGDVDPRLEVQEQVLGVVAPEGGPVAFSAAAARTALDAGERVVFGEIEIVRDGGGLRAIDAAGNEVSAHQSFWFAWSQFHPDTQVWVP